MMGFDHPICVPVDPFACELWHFEYFPTTTVRHFEFNFFLFDHVTVIVVRICCCMPNFIKINSRVRLPDTHNCSVSSAPLLGNGRPLPWQPHYGGHVGNVMGCDQSRFVPIGPLLSELWYFQYFPTWRPSAILNFKNFNI